MDGQAALRLGISFALADYQPRRITCCASDRCSAAEAGQTKSSKPREACPSIRSGFSAGCSGWKIRDWLGWAEWRGGKGGDKSRHIHRLFKVLKKIEIYADGNMEGIVVQWREG